MPRQKTHQVRAPKSRTIVVVVPASPGGMYFPAPPTNSGRDRSSARPNDERSGRLRHPKHKGRGWD